MREKQSYLIGCDFDGNQFKTFDPSPNGLGVEGAYQVGISTIMGLEGIQTYFEQGGLQNRSPYQLVEALVGSKNGRGVVSVAKSFFQRNGQDIAKHIPEYAGGEVFNWNKQNPTQTITQMLVGVRLHLMLNEIGRSGKDGSLWPNPCQGYIDFSKEVDHLKREAGVKIALAVVSSGHHAFIEKVFNVYGLTKPDIIISEDTIRPLKNPQESSRRFKPGALPLALAHFEWAKSLNLTDQNGDLSHQHMVALKDRMMYTGDDKTKDGRMAQVAKLPFGHFVGGSDYSKVNGVYTKDQFPFNDWRLLSKHFKDSADSLREGKSLREVLSSILSPDTKTREGVLIHD